MARSNTPTANKPEEMDKGWQMFQAALALWIATNNYDPRKQ
jgi:hypothetical protein